MAIGFYNSLYNRTSRDENGVTNVAILISVLWDCVRCDCVACSEDEFKCHSTGLCISASRVCNGDNNCGDWSDENCSEWYFYYLTALYINVE